MHLSPFGRTVADFDEVGLHPKTATNPAAAGRLQKIKPKYLTAKNTKIIEKEQD